MNLRRSSICLVLRVNPGSHPRLWRIDHIHRDFGTNRCLEVVFMHQRLGGVRALWAVIIDLIYRNAKIEVKKVLNMACVLRFLKTILNLQERY